MLVAIALVLLAALLPAPARAQGTPAARQELIVRARAASEEERWNDALDLARRAGRIRMTPSLQLFIAETHRNADHPVEAVTSAEACVRAAEPDAGLRDRETILASCRAVLTEMRRRVGHVVIHVRPRRFAGLEVRVAGQVVPVTRSGQRFPVVAGEVRVRAQRGGQIVFDQELAVAGQTEVPVEIEIGEARPLAESRDVPEPEPALRDDGPSLVGPIVVLAVAGASFGAAGGFFAARESAVSDRDAACDEGGCDESALDDHDRAGTFNTLTNVAIGGGAVAAAVGATWLIFALAGRPSEDDAQLQVVPSEAGVSFHARVRF